MKIRLQITVVVFLLSCGVAQAGPVLLASFDHGVDGELPPDNRIGFVLQLLDFDNNLGYLGPPLGGATADVRDGPMVFWEDGETGVLEFTSGADPEFDAFAHFLTDGVDDVLIVFWQWEDDGGFGGGGAFESQMFGHDTDLVGNTLDLIRLTVHEVSIEPSGGNLVSVSTRVTYDFLGSPVPEPATLVLFVLGGLITLTGRLAR